MRKDWLRQLKRCGIVLVVLAGWKLTLLLTLQLSSSPPTLQTVLAFEEGPESPRDLASAVVAGSTPSPFYEYEIVPGLATT